MTAIYIMLLVMLPILVPAIKRQLRKPEFDDEYMFDDFVCNDLFTQDQFNVVNHTIEFGTDVFPGFLVKQISDNFQFYIITKYTKNTKTNEIQWCDKKHFLHYQILKDSPVYIVLGVGGPSHFPDQLFMIPFKRIYSNKLTQSELMVYAITHGEEINFNIS